MAYEQFPYWLKNQRDKADGELARLSHENTELKKKIQELEQEIKKLKNE